MNKKFILGIKLGVICFFNFFLVHPAFCDVEIGIAAFNNDGSLPTVEGDNQIKNFESDLGKKNLATFNWYMGFDGDDSNGTIDKEFPLSDLVKVRDHDGYNTGIVPMLTWEPWNLEKINNGDLDGYIKGFASKMKEYNAPIRLRFGHEMIQDDNPDTPGWYPWQDQAAAYKNAFTHVHDIFYDAEKYGVGATKVEFVWSPNNYPFDKTVLEKYYPGNDYVNWLGMDGYNWNGDGTITNPEQHFDDIFYNIYHNMADNPEIFGGKPVMIAEFATWGDEKKAAWITEAFNKIKNEYPDIEAFYWFNINKEFDWRLESSEESWDAFDLAMQDPYYKGHVTPEPVSSALFLLGAAALASRGLLRKKRQA